MVYFEERKNGLEVHYFGEIFRIEGWGENALRVRGTREKQMPNRDWALLPDKGKTSEIKINKDGAEITNGTITARVDTYGRVAFIANKTGKTLLKEYWRYRVDNKPDNPDQGHGGTDMIPGLGGATQMAGREYRPILGGSYEITMRFESEPNEKIFGMGQYQQPYLNLKNTVLELAQKNSQASVPFLISSLGYGFLWNVPAVGNVEFCKNITQWHASCADTADYWITAGDTPAQIEEDYAMVTGTVPMMPDWAMGFWQSKLRYQTPEEVLYVTNEYKKRNLPLDVLVIDYFHWPYQGEWKFDETYWTGVEEMIQTVQDMGIKLMVSVWPLVDYRSENYKEMKAKGYLLRSDRGFPISMNYMGNTIAYDAFHPQARKYLWDKIKKNYYDKGIETFWLDEAEPEFTVYDYDIVRNYEGPHMSNGNFYPVEYAKTFYEGMAGEGQDKIINLLRCAWAGSQRYGALVWSGDIYSSFESMRCQITAGLNMGLAGIPWWTTDIGGFYGAMTDDSQFHELFARWFAYGTFCPVMRVHGFRLPKKPQIGSTGGAECLSGADNEVWSFGEEVYEICREYLDIRVRMKPYIKKLMKEAHEKGTPVMRTLFYEFPQDERCWEIEDSYMFGPDMLIAPITESGVAKRQVYLPRDARWTDAWTSETYEGGTELCLDVPLNKIPVFIRDNGKNYIQSI